MYREYFPLARSCLSLSLSVPSEEHNIFSFSFFFILFLAALGLHYPVRFSLVAVNSGYSVLWCTGFLFWGTGSRLFGF